MEREMGTLKEWLIGISLFIVIPATLYLGCNLLSPKIDFKMYHTARTKFFEGYKYKEREKYQKREQEWKQTAEFKDYEYKTCKSNFVYLTIIGPVSCLLMYIGTVFIMPVVSSAIIMTSVVSLMFYSYAYKSCAEFYGMGLFWFELLFVFINLMLVLVASYRLSEE